MLTRGDQPAIGLRERKKAKTHAAIQEEALRLFREQGYDATTVEQIAEAAEVSPSTFFRYFPTKEDVVFYDVLDPPMVESFRAQPRELNPIQAMRQAFRAVFATLSAEELARQQERKALLFAVPELRAAWLGELANTVQLIAALIAERVGRPADDFAVRNLAGAVLGVAMAAMLSAVEDPKKELFELIDPALAHLEAGLPL